jgi:hypothetical protein
LKIRQKGEKRRQSFPYTKAIFQRLLELECPKLQSGVFSLQTTYFTHTEKEIAVPHIG